MSSKANPKRPQTARTVKRRYRKAWACAIFRGARMVSSHPCIFGSRGFARENKDEDETVVQIEYRVVKVDAR